MHGGWSASSNALTTTVSHLTPFSSFFSGVHFHLNIRYNMPGAADTAHMNGNGVASTQQTNGAARGGGAVGTFRVKAGLAQMLKGGVIMGKSTIISYVTFGRGMWCFIHISGSI